MQFINVGIYGWLGLLWLVAMAVYVAGSMWRDRKPGRHAVDSKPPWKRGPFA